MVRRPPAHSALPSDNLPDWARPGVLRSPPPRSPPPEHSAAGDNDSLLTLSAAAGLLQVSTRTLRRWVASGDLPRIRLGTRTIRLRRQDLDHFVARSRG